MVIKNKDYQILMEKIIEWEKTRYFQPSNLWSYNMFKSYIATDRINKTYAKRYNGIKNGLTKIFFTDNELYSKTKELSSIFLMISYRFEIIYFSAIIILFGIIIYFGIVPDITITLPNRPFDGSYANVNIFFILSPVVVFILYAFASFRLSLKKDYLETTMFEIKRIIEYRIGIKEIRTRKQRKSKKRRTGKKY